MRIDYCGMRAGRAWSFESDKVGRELLLHYLYGKGEDFPSNEEHGQYLMENECLKNKVRSILFQHTRSIRPGDTVAIDLSVHMEIENGEGIIGYQYLHGTNADVGDFQISGTAKRTLDGSVIYDLKYTWNDVMDSNMSYGTDKMKAFFAEIFTFGGAQSYNLAISWSDTSIAPYSYDLSSAEGTGWLFS